MPPVPVILPYTPNINEPALRVPPELIVRLLMVVLFPNIGLFGVPKEIIIESVAPGTRPISQLPGIFQSVEMVPVHVAAPAVAVILAVVVGAPTRERL